jgi:anaerobic carbon-monoxide dehydrogenase iron sulfur subunit
MEPRPELLSINPEVCNGCRICEIACSMKHHGTCNPDLARIRILHLTISTGHLPIVCTACNDAPCIKVCPLNARVREANGAVTTDEERCIGCRACIYICPTGSPTINRATHKTMTCDMCQGETKPWCVTACKAGALRMVDEEGALCGRTVREQASRMRIGVRRG